MAAFRPEAPQLSLFDAAPALPEGMVYRRDLLTPEGQAELVARIGELTFKPFEFRGYEAARRVAYFGWSYDYDARRIKAATPIPDFLLPLREAAARFAGVEAEALRQILINHYAPGAGVGWHRDRPAFGDVVGVSLGSPALFRFRRANGEGWERRRLMLEPGSVYLLRGPARDAWEHSVPPVEAPRYSVTFRTLRDAAAG